MLEKWSKFEKNLNKSEHSEKKLKMFWVIFAKNISRRALKVSRIDAAH